MLFDYLFGKKIKQFSATCSSPSRVPTPFSPLTKQFTGLFCSAECCLIRNFQKFAYVPYREFLFGQECSHSKIPLEVDCGYCPDCGELVENQWFILRCACCGVKVRAVIRNGQIVPLEKHCTNCGMAEFNVERLEKVNFINVNYAVLLKKTVQAENFDFTQSWVDVASSRTSYGKLGLLR